MGEDQVNRFVWVSSTGENLSVALRMQDEGADISVYVHNPEYKNVYSGMLKQRVNGVSELAALLRDADPKSTTIIFDGMPRATQRDEDIEIAKIRGIYKPQTKGTALFGALGGFLQRKKDFTVVGATRLGDDLHHSRTECYDFADTLGVQRPEHYSHDDCVESVVESLQTQPFASKTCEMVYAGGRYVEREPGELLKKMRGSGWYPEAIDEHGFVITVVSPGAMIREEAWFDGAQFRALTGVMEKTRLMPGGLGPEVGVSMSLRWAKRSPLFKWDRLREVLQQKNYVGPASATFRIAGHGALLTEWTIGLCGQPSIFSMIRGGISSWFDRGFSAAIDEDVTALGVLVSIPPFPTSNAGTAGVELNVRPSSGVYLIDARQGVKNLECAGTSGAVAHIIGRDSDPVGTVNALDAQIRGFSASSDLQYRTDYSDLMKEFRQLNPRFRR